MYNPTYNRYELELVGGPKDGEIEHIIAPLNEIKFYTIAGRVAIYERVSDSKFLFSGYRENI